MTGLMLRHSAGFKGRQLILRSLVALACLGAGPAILFAGHIGRDAACVIARAAPITPHLEAYGQVEPIAVLPVIAAEQGIIMGLGVLPGVRVQAGEALAHLTGPEIRMTLQMDRADVRSAQAQLAAAQKSLAILQQQLTAHLSTRQAIHQAQGALAQAQTNFDNAESRLRSQRQMITLISPTDATVLAVNAANGQLVTAGLPILTLQIPGRLWLKASYYGADSAAIRPGMRGTFSPADGSGAIPIRVREVFGPLTAGGAESVAMVPEGQGARWKNGEYGAVKLELPKRMMVAVPTRSLVLNQGKWWVLVRSATGDHPQAVVPGPARGWETFIEGGLKPGTQVVVENAYFLFHRSIAQTYQPPD